jgi:gentisate 1,2-dioxygenase
MSVVDRHEKERAHEGSKEADFYATALQRAADFRAAYVGRLNVVKWQDMPFERSPDGLIKHIVNEAMDTKECCIDVYMQFLPPEKASGKHRHLSEEVFYVVEGRGHDLHWDVQFDCKDEFDFSWASEPKRYDWSEGDFVYIPPYCAHQHVNDDPSREARLIVVNSRIVRAMGFDWFEQLENAEGF